MPCWSSLEAEASFAMLCYPTYVFKDASVKLLTVHWVFLNLPVARVDNTAMLTAQDEATAVWNGVRDSQGLDPAAHHPVPVNALSGMPFLISQLRCALTWFVPCISKKKPTRWQCLQLIVM